MQLATLLLEQKYISRIRVRAVRNELTLCMRGNLACFLLSADFFQSTFLKNSYQEYRQSVKQFGSRSPAGPDLDQNCLQRLSVDKI